MQEQFTYAVARIRCKELMLLSEVDINRMLACNNYKECINILRDKGWGNEDSELENYHALLSAEESKLWQFIFELVPNRINYKIILLPIDFHNLKAAIKGFMTKSLSENLFISGGTIKTEKMIKIIENSDFGELPDYMIEPARLAFEKLLYTGDGQICDNILDKALLETIKREGKISKNSLIKSYAEFYIASSNIKIAIRSQILNKNTNFIRSQLVKCNTLDTEKLAIESQKGQEALCEYLLFTDYAESVPFIKESLQKFEIWRDNKIIELIKNEKYKSFSIGPIIAYILARQNEFKVARIILSGKLHSINNDLIKERLRNMYA